MQNILILIISHEKFEDTEKECDILKNNRQYKERGQKDKQ